eukprot:1159196-Pelagomonas_calceolata.AAC.3
MGQTICCEELLAAPEGAKSRASAAFYYIIRHVHLNVPKHAYLALLFPGHTSAASKCGIVHTSVSLRMPAGLPFFRAHTSAASHYAILYTPVSLSMPAWPSSSRANTSSSNQWPRAKPAVTGL